MLFLRFSLSFFAFLEILRAEDAMGNVCIIQSSRNAKGERGRSRSISSDLGSRTVPQIFPPPPPPSQRGQAMSKEESFSKRSSGQSSDAEKKVSAKKKYGLIPDHFKTLEQVRFFFFFFNITMICFLHLASSVLFFLFDVCLFCDD